MSEKVIFFKVNLNVVQILSFCQHLSYGSKRSCGNLHEDIQHTLEDSLPVGKIRIINIF